MEYKTYAFEQIIDDVRLSQEAWDRVKSAPKEEYIEAVRRELTWPEGFLEKLRGKSLEEQMKYYCIVEEEYHSRTAYGEITKENMRSFGYALENYSGVKGLIIDDGVIIGVKMKYAFDWQGTGVPAFPYQTICTYSASDNNGSGYVDRDDYAHLCCVTEGE